MKSSIPQILSHFSLYISNISIFKFYTRVSEILFLIPYYISPNLFFYSSYQTTYQASNHNHHGKSFVLSCHHQYRCSPVIKPAFSEQRNSTILAISIGFPTRWTGCCTASAPVYSVKSVSIHPEEIELTRTLPARLTANAWVNAEIPPLAAV